MRTAAIASGLITLLCSTPSLAQTTVSSPSVAAPAPPALTHPAPAHPAPAHPAPTHPAPAAPAAPGAPAAPSRETHLYIGMVTTHLNADHLHIDNNWLVGVTHGHFYGATFLNSFGDRAFAVGAQKILFSGRNPNKRASLGMRAGAITGYDERFLGFAKDTPVLPMFSVFSLFEVKRAGLELSWTMVIASASFCIRF